MDRAAIAFRKSGWGRAVLVRPQIIKTWGGRAALDPSHPATS
jgi:hypothetical protein